MNSRIKAGQHWQHLDGKIHRVIEARKDQIITWTDYKDAPGQQGASFLGPVALFLGQFKRLENIE